MSLRREVARGITKGLFFAVIAVIGVLIGAAGLLAAIHEPHTSISMNIVNQTNVLDVRKPLEELSVSFRGEDIQKRNLNLCVITLKVENDGEVNILQSQFDKNCIWGVGMESSEIIEARLINASSDYVKSNLNLTIIEESSAIEFNKIIFDRKDSFTVEILVVHDKAAEPKLIPLGKIAGIEEVKITRAETEVEGSFVKRTFSGNMWVQITRVACYFIAGVIIIIIAVFIVIGISNVKEEMGRKSRKGKIEHFFDSLDEGEVRNLKIEKTLKEIYANRGNKAMVAVRDILEKPSAHRAEIEEGKKSRRLIRRISSGEGGIYVGGLEEFGTDEYVREVIVERLVKDELIRIGKNNRVEVEKGFSTTLSGLMKYLDIKEND